MATASKRVGRSETIELADGTEVELRPLNIKKLKEFMRKFGELDTLDPAAEDSETASMDILVDMAAISVSKDLKDATRYLYMSKDDEGYGDARDEWEELVDQDTVAFINEICGGIKFKTPGDVDGDFPEEGKG